MYLNLNYLTSDELPDVVLKFFKKTTITHVGNSTVTKGRQWCPSVADRINIHIL